MSAYFFTSENAPERCAVCGEGLTNGECPNDGDPNHDRIQDELWDEQDLRYELNKQDLRYE